MAEKWQYKAPEEIRRIVRNAPVVQEAAELLFIIQTLAEEGFIETKMRRDRWEQWKKRTKDVLKELR